MTVHDEKSLYCNICNKVFESSKSLAIHKGHHSRTNKVKIPEKMSSCKGDEAKEYHQVKTEGEENET